MTQQDFKSEFQALQEETDQVTAILAKRPQLPSIRLVTREMFQELKSDQARTNEKLMEIINALQKELRDTQQKLADLKERVDEQGPVRERLV